MFLELIYDRFTTVPSSFCCHRYWSNTHILCRKTRLQSWPFSGAIDRFWFFLEIRLARILLTVNLARPKLIQLIMKRFHSVILAQFWTGMTGTRPKTVWKLMARTLSSHQQQDLLVNWVDKQQCSFAIHPEMRLSSRHTAKNLWYLLIEGRLKSL